MHSLRLLPAGAADGMVPFHLIYIDKKDIDAAGLTYLEACQKLADEYKDTCGAVDIVDTNAVTVSSDGIMGDAAVVAFASIDHGKINQDFGFINVSEYPYYPGIIEDEPHMTQWNSDYYAGKRLYRGPNTQDRGYRNPHNENMTMTGRIANNNTGSEMMNMVWNSFVLTGDPNCAAIPSWKPYCSSMEGERMYFSAGPKTQPFDLSKDCDHEMPVQVIHF